MGDVFQEKTCFYQRNYQNFHVEIKNQILALDRPELKFINACLVGKIIRKQCIIKEFFRHTGLGIVIDNKCC